MPGFYYFVPETQAQGPAEAVLREAGAGHVLEPPRPDWVHAAQGPQGHGMLAIRRGADGALGEVGYFPDRQRWQAAPGRRYFVGHLAAALPGPEDLARVRTLPGYRVEMGDGRQWVIPVARAYDVRGGMLRCHEALPCVRLLDDQGVWGPGAVVGLYTDLWHHVERHVGLLDRARAGDAAAIEEAGDYQQESEMVVAALRANYRVGSVEASLLGLVTSAVVVPVLEALLDRPALEELSKKVRASGVGSISPGATA